MNVMAVEILQINVLIIPENGKDVIIEIVVSRKT
jgi:hypothetical protein